MKKHLISSLLCFLILTAKAQVYKSFLNKQSEICDSVNAHSYILYSFGSDSIWHLQNHLVKDGTLLIKGSYKDKNMQKPHGLFSYYSKGDSGKYYLETKGVYLDGQQQGIWTKYSRNSMIQSRETYKNGLKHGESQNYNALTGKLDYSGNFAEGLKEGEWTTFDEYNNPIETSLYKKNEFISRTKHARVYRKPSVSASFEKHIKSSIKELINNNRDYGMFLVRAALAEDGRLSKISINYTFGGASNFNDEIIKILSNSPTWEPAYNEKEHKPIKDSVEFLIRYSKFGVSTIFNQSGIHFHPSGSSRFVDIQPVPPGGISQFLHDFTMSIKYPGEALKNKAKGRIIASFVVETDGSLSDFKILRGIGYGLDEEVIRSLKHSSKWFPGIQNSKPVRVAYTLPINFAQDEPQTF